MTAMLVIAFIVLIGPLALLYGADSRIDDRRNGCGERARSPSSSRGGQRPLRIRGRRRRVRNASVAAGS